MAKESPLKDKVILVVDDEPDVLETVADELDMSIVHKAKDYETPPVSLELHVRCRDPGYHGGQRL